MTKILILLSLILSLSVSAQDGDLDDIKSCLSKFEGHPFDKTNPSYTTIAAKVKVLGVGGSTVDEVVTDTPKLILIRPAVTVLAKSHIRLMNPNGWYCIKGQVSVLGKAVIHLHCNAKLASSEDGVTVLGGGENGVTVLGSSQLVREKCAEAKKL